MVAVTDAVRTEREALVAFLETLTPEQWATPSLCPGWDVRAVAAHLAWASSLSLPETLRELVRARGRPNRLVAGTAVRWAQRSTPAILDQLRRNAEEGAKPVGMPWGAALLDAVVHGLDVRRPLDAPRILPADAFRGAADFAAAARWPTSALLGGGGHRRVAGLRLVAQDQDWSAGEGLEVRASADAVLLVLTGRQVGRAELAGPGASVLAARLAQARGLTR